MPIPTQRRAGVPVHAYASYPGPSPVPPAGYPGGGPRLDDEELAELNHAHRVWELRILQTKRDIAWDAVITEAIRVCRLLAKAETEAAAPARKYNPNWEDQPRVPAGNADGGQWAGGSGAGGDSRAATAGAGTAPGMPDISTEAVRAAAKAAAQRAYEALQQLGRQVGQRFGKAGAIAASPFAVGAAGILLLASAGPAGGARRRFEATLGDGTLVEVIRDDSGPHAIVRGESPDGTVTFATITTGADGKPKVLNAAVRHRGREPQHLDGAAMTAAASAIINAAASGNGGKRGTGSKPDTSGIAATPPPEDEEPTHQRVTPSRTDAKPDYTSPSARDLNKAIGDEQRALVRQFFGSVERSAGQGTKVAIPQGLTRDTLLMYREIALRALAPTGGKRLTPLTIEVQSKRLRAIEKALEVLK